MDRQDLCDCQMDCFNRFEDFALVNCNAKMSGSFVSTKK